MDHKNNNKNYLFGTHLRYRRTGSGGSYTGEDLLSPVLPTHAHVSLIVMYQPSHP